MTKPLDARPAGTLAPSAAEALPSGLALRPGFLIRRLHQIHTSLFLEETAGHELTAVQFSVLTALAERGELDQNSIAVEIGLERSSVAEVLPRLAARGLVARRQSPDDGRVRLTKLTPKGRAVVRQLRDATRRAHERAIEALPPDDRARFIQQLLILVEANNDRCVAPLRLR